MKIVICPDKFKGTLSASEMADAIESAVKQINSEIETIVLPLSDGGDGFLDVLVNLFHAKKREMMVYNPLFKPITTWYAINNELKTAYIEMAKASGLQLLNEYERNPCLTSTYGTGEMILDAIENGAKHIILGIGGSATNDAGIGMAVALGYRFFDTVGNEIKPIGGNLKEIALIDDTHLKFNPLDIDFKVACDVKINLYGSNGATYTFARQKGATPDQIEHLDRGLMNFAELIFEKYSMDLQAIEGAGAAGGMGAGAIVFFKAKLVSGIQLIMNELNFDEIVKSADLIITGEGKLDSQSRQGKVISGVIEKAKKYGKPVTAICGQVALNKQEVGDFGLKGAYSLFSNDETSMISVPMSYKRLLPEVDKALHDNYLISKPIQIDYSVEM